MQNITVEFQSQSTQRRSGAPLHWMTVACCSAEGEERTLLCIWPLLSVAPSSKSLSPIAIRGVRPGEGGGLFQAPSSLSSSHIQGVFTIYQGNDEASLRRTDSHLKCKHGDNFQNLTPETSFKVNGVVLHC